MFRGTWMEKISSNSRWSCWNLNRRFPKNCSKVRPSAQIKPQPRSAVLLALSKVFRPLDPEKPNIPEGISTLVLFSDPFWVYWLALSQLFLFFPAAAFIANRSLPIPIFGLPPPRRDARGSTEYLAKGRKPTKTKQGVGRRRYRQLTLTW